MKVRRTPPESKHSRHDSLLRSKADESQASRRAGMVPRTVCECRWLHRLSPGLALLTSDKPTDETSLSDEAVLLTEIRDLLRDRRAV